MKTILSKLLIIFLSLNLVLTSFYPFFFTDRVYAAIYYDEFGQEYGEPDPVEEAPPAETQQAEIPQDPSIDESSNQNNETPEPASAVSSYNDPYSDYIAESEDINLQNAVEDAEAREQAALNYQPDQEIAQTVVGAVNDVTSTGVEEVTQMADNFSSVYHTSYDSLLASRQTGQDPAVLAAAMEETSQVVRRSDEQYKQDLQKAINAPESEKIQAMREALKLPEGGFSDADVQVIFRDAARNAGIKIEGDFSKYIISLPKTTLAIPGLSSGQLSNTQELKYTPACDALEGDQLQECQATWKEVGKDILIAEGAAGAVVAVVTAPVWIPVAAAGLGTVTTFVSTASLTTYVYTTSAVGVLLTNSPRIVQTGVGILAETADVIIPAATWGLCQRAMNPGACVQENLGQIPEVGALINEAKSAINTTKTAVQAEKNLNFAVDTAINLTGSGITKKLATSEQSAVDQVLENYGLTRDSIVYRTTPKQYVEDGVIKANPNSMAVVHDPYNLVDNPYYEAGSPLPAKIPPNVKASSLEDPSLNVAVSPRSAESYASEDGNSVLVGIRVGDVLDQGGKIYPDVGGMLGDALIVTVPEGGIKAASVTQVGSASLLDNVQQTFEDVTSDARNFIADETGSLNLGSIFGRKDVPEKVNQTVDQQIKQEIDKMLPSNIKADSVLTADKADDFQIKGIQTGGGALIKIYPDKEFNVFSTQGSSAVIFEDVADPNKVYKVYRNGMESDFTYSAKEATNIKSLFTEGLAPKLYEYKGAGTSSVPVLVMDKIDFSVDGYKQLTASHLEEEINRVTAGLRKLNLEPGDVEFVVNNKTGHLISVDSGGFRPLRQDGLTVAGETLEQSVRSELENSMFGTVFGDFRKSSNPVSLAVTGKAQLKKLGFSDDVIKKEMNERYEWAFSGRYPNGKFDNILPPPFDQDVKGDLFNLANKVADGASDKEVQQISGSLVGKYPQQVVDEAVKAGRNVNKTSVVVAQTATVTKQSGSEGVIDRVKQFFSDETGSLNLGAIFGRKNTQQAETKVIIAEAPEKIETIINATDKNIAISDTSLDQARQGLESLPEFGKHLGEGNFGQTYSDGKLVTKILKEWPYGSILAESNVLAVASQIQAMEKAVGVGGLSKLEGLIYDGKGNLVGFKQELIDGIPLDKYVAQGKKVKLEDVQNLYEDIQKLHDITGIPHGDLHEANIMVQEIQNMDGSVTTRLRLIDYGAFPWDVGMTSYNQRIRAGKNRDIKDLAGMMISRYDVNGVEQRLVNASPDEVTAYAQKIVNNSYGDDGEEIFDFLKESFKDPVKLESLSSPDIFAVDITNAEKMRVNQPLVASVPSNTEKTRIDQPLMATVPSNTEKGGLEGVLDRVKQFFSDETGSLNLGAIFGKKSAQKTEQAISSSDTVVIDQFFENNDLTRDSIYVGVEAKSKEQLLDVTEQGWQQTILDETPISFSVTDLFGSEISTKAKALLRLVEPYTQEYSDEILESALGDRLTRLGGLLKKGVSAGEILQKAKMAEEIFSGIDSVNSRRALDAIRYNGTAYSNDITLDAIDALIAQEENITELQPTLNESKKVLTALNEYVVENGGSTKGLPDVERVVDPKDIYVVSQDKMPLGSERFAGLYYGSDNKILIKRDYRDFINVCTHEMAHACFAAGPFDQEELAKEIGGKIADYAKNVTDDKTKFAFEWSNKKKFTEGLTEWTTQMGHQILGISPAYLAYDPQVATINKIATMLDAKLGSMAQANRVLIETQLKGEPEILFKALGNGNVTKGANIVADLMDKTPDITNVDVVVTNRLLTKYDISKAIMTVEVALAAGMAAGGISLEKEQDFVPQISPTPILLPFRLVSNVFAKENDVIESTAINSQSFELLVKKQLIKDALMADGRVDSEYVKDVLKTDILKSEVKQINNGYQFTTGQTGNVEEEIAIGRYVFSVKPIPGVDLKIPSIVTISKGSSVVIPVMAKKGSGQVIKVEILSRKDQGLVKSAYADDIKDASASSKVQVAIFNEDGSKSLPWAGVEVKLTKIVQEQAIALNQGWNLVTLTAIPTKGMTASTLISEISKQGGYVTTVSTLEDSFWKSYVERTGKVYSGDDFIIEPGKAYFVKAEKQSNFTFEGQNFTDPLKLELTSGWNAVGMPKTSKSYKAADLPFLTTASWDFGLWNTFVKKDNQNYGDNFQIFNNKGYILKVEKTGDFSP